MRNYRRFSYTSIHRIRVYFFILKKWNFNELNSWAIEEASVMNRIVRKREEYKTKKKYFHIVERVGCLWVRSCKDC